MEKQVITITTDELDVIKQIQNEYQQIVLSLGQIEIEKSLLMNRRTEIDKSLDEIKIKEKNVLDSLQIKYGQGTLDLNNGTFTPFK